MRLGGLRIKPHVEARVGGEKGRVLPRQQTPLRVGDDKSFLDQLLGQNLRLSPSACNSGPLQQVS